MPLLLALAIYYPHKSSLRHNNRRMLTSENILPRRWVNKGKKKDQGVRPGPTIGPRRPHFGESIPRTVSYLRGAAGLFLVHHLSRLETH